VEKTQREIIIEWAEAERKRGIGKYCDQFRGKKIKLQDLLIFDGLYDPDKIQKEDFLEGDGMKVKRSALILDFCNIVYASDWYDPFLETVRGTDFRWYKWSASSKYLKNVDLIKEASIEDIYKSLISIVRMEHWNNGFIYRAAKTGRIFAILNRIKELIKLGELY
jgi:hypothetical protein